MTGSANRRHGFPTGVLPLALLIAVLPAAALRAQSVPIGGSGEAGLWRLWITHMAAGAGNARQAEALQAFAARRPPDPFAPVAQTMAAWHLLKQGRIDSARDLLEPLAANPAGDAIGRGARDIARAWLTCLDRDQVVTALDQYRLREVRYPERLAELENWPHLAAKPPMLDRWGNRWEYRTERLLSMPMLAAQRYTLTSRMLGDASALETALALTYAERIAYVPVQVRASPGRPAVVSLLPEGAAAGAAPALVMAGSAHEGITVAHVSAALIILHDRLHWKLALTPKR